MESELYTEMTAEGSTLTIAGDFWKLYIFVDPACQLLTE